MNLLARLRRWQQRRVSAVVEVTDERFSVDYRGKSHSMRWADVDRIEAGRQPSLVVDIFYAILFDGMKRTLKVDDIMLGFKEFEASVFEHWPLVETAWTAIYLGSPNKSEHATLWSRQAR